MTEVVLAIALGLAVIIIVVLLRRTTDTAPALGDLYDDDPAESSDDRTWALGILDHLEEGVIVLSESMTPVMANAAARSMLGMPTDGLPALLTSQEVTSVARRALVEARAIDSSLNMRAAGSYLQLRAVPLDEPPGVLLSLRDTTVEQRTQHLRRQFVANASHELKTPVASMQALAEALVDAVGRDPEAAGRFGDRLVVESQRLGDLIKDLLDLSRVEDPATLNATDVDLAELVRIQLKSFEAVADAKRIALEGEIASAVHVLGDDAQLELMVRNLIDNALRYTSEDGHVGVTLTTDPGDAILEVADDGAGIPLRAQARVFERFFRVDDDRARAGGGTGLGLAIVKNVAESHAGSVTLASEMDAGSTFTVRLPLVGERR